MAELKVATVRAQVMLSLVTDFEAFRTFRPMPPREGELTELLDQVVAWAAALRPQRKPKVRETDALPASASR